MNTEPRPPAGQPTSLPTCFRHPDRETRLACTACGRAICTECMHQAPVGQRCPECARPAPGQRTITAEELRAGARRSAPFTFAVLGVCVALALVGMAVPAMRLELFRHGAQVNGLIAAGEHWRLVTAAFLHADLMHLAFNMYALYLFGPPLEREAGSGAFALLYLAAALCGGAVFYLIAGPFQPAVGASGAIFGLFGAWLAAAVRSRRTMEGRANLRSMLVLLAINAALPLFIPIIAWQAHLGGFVAGFVIAGAWLLLGVRGVRSSVARSAVALAVCAVAVVVVLAL